MPTYVYRCAEDHEFEAIQRITEEPLTACAECGGPARRVVLPVGIVFKGSGFYKTDSRRAESATAATSSAPSRDTKSSPTEPQAASDAGGPSPKPAAVPGATTAASSPSAAAASTSPTG